MSINIRLCDDTIPKALHVLAFAFLLGVHLCSTPASAAGFDCAWRPVDADTSDVHDVKSILPVGDPLDDPTKLMSAVDTLRRQGLAEVLIIDNLIGEYCPVVAADASLNDAEKTARLRRFATMATGLVYSIEDATEIVLDIPFSPDVVDQIKTRAKAAGISPEAWVASAVSTTIKEAP